MFDILHYGRNEERVRNFEESREDRPLDFDRYSSGEIVVEFNFLSVFLQFPFV